MPTVFPFSLTASRRILFSIIFCAASFTLESMETMVNGYDMLFSTFSSLMLVPPASQSFSSAISLSTTVRRRSLSVIMPTGVLYLTTTRLPMCFSPIIWAASYKVASGAIVTTSRTIISDKSRRRLLFL